MWRDTLHQLEIAAASWLFARYPQPFLLRLWERYSESMRQESMARYRRTARRLLRNGPRLFNAWRALENYPMLWLAKEDFSRMDLRFTNWRNCILAHTTFEGARLNNCSFEGAILHQTNFTQANLTHVNMQGQDWSDVVGADAQIWTVKNRWLAPPPALYIRALAAIRKRGKKRSVPLYLANNTVDEVTVRLTLRQTQSPIANLEVVIAAGATREVTLEGKPDSQSWRYLIDYAAFKAGEERAVTEGLMKLFSR